MASPPLSLTLPATAHQGAPADAHRDGTRNTSGSIFRAFEPVPPWVRYSNGGSLLSPGEVSWPWPRISASCAMLTVVSAFLGPLKIKP